ncbi:hypothetical protein BDV23DRAFT_153313 [Aspergillus alliaceus]|uniref:Uncharacterized protein n=2 Tax=Petromyces alliaceus TaxID=209559 RepID=A0A5N7CAZ5_PETAA|nr:hypothetical protein BDV23DRAFT_153313 [Aspergillus alliaceus]
MPGDFSHADVKSRSYGTSPYIHTESTKFSHSPDTPSELSCVPSFALEFRALAACMRPESSP